MTGKAANGIFGQGSGAIRLPGPEILVIALTVVKHGQIDLGRKELGIDGNGLLVKFNRLLVFSKVGGQVAQVIPLGRKVRVVKHGPAELVSRRGSTSMLRA